MEKPVNDKKESGHSLEKSAADNGSQELIEKYNINDQAYAKSSLHDFVPTTSAFNHADGENPDKAPDKETGE